MVRHLFVTSLVGILCGTLRAQTVLLELDSYPGGFFGRSLSGAGDVDADGYADVIVGASQGDAYGGYDPGYASVYSGRLGTTLYTFKGAVDGDNLGWSVSGLGDVNGDGYDDVMAGAPIVIGSPRKAFVRVYSGKDGSLVYQITSSASGDHFGISVSDLGDVNGDGRPDVLVGAAFADSGGSDSGNASVFSGTDGKLLFTVSGDSALDYLGISVSGADDVNLDGFPDLIAGADWDDKNGTNSGTATVFSGKDASLIHTFHGLGANDWLGHSVHGAGDVDLDGHPDLIVGAPEGDFLYGDYGPGYAQVFSGKDASLLYQWTSGSAWDFGVAVSGAGDVDGDGHADLLVGDWFESMGGGAYVYSGIDGSVLYHTTGGYNWGSAVASAGDVNHDGHADFLVSAYPADQAVLFSGGPCGASWSNYGSGWPGTNGVPAFTCSANPKLCSKITINLDNSAGVATNGTLLVGLNPASIPTALGGTLNVVPLFVVPIIIPANGAHALVQIPCDPSLCGIACYLQAMEVDPGASLGVSFTRGLQMSLGG